MATLRPNLRLALACWFFASLAAYPVHFIGRRIHSFAGPFRAVVERCEPCGGEAWVAVNVARVSRPRHVGDPQRVSGNVTARVRLDDTVTTVLKIDQWSNNGWKSNAFVLSVGGLCSGLRSLGLDLGEGAPPDELCAVAEGVHSFSEHPADWRFASVPEFPYGKWRAAAIFSRHDTTLGCVRCLFQTSPEVGSDL